MASAITDSSITPIVASPSSALSFLVADLADNSASTGKPKVKQVPAINASGAMTLPVQSATVKLTDGNDKNVSYAAYGTGTTYTLTATPAKITFGTTSPTVTLAAAGTYLLEGLANVKLVGATFAASRDVVIKVRRTNNTAADIASTSATVATPIVTTVTQGLGQIASYSVLYTATAGDVLELWGSVSVVPTAGSIQVVEASLTAVRLY